MGRTLPHSLEAEEYLLSCCLLDGSDTIARCLEAKLAGAAFYGPANRLIYEKLCEIYQTRPPVDIAVGARTVLAHKGPLTPRQKRAPLRAARRSGRMDSRRAAPAG